MWEARPAVEPSAPERPEPEPEPVAPPEPEFVELVIPADAVIGLQLESTVSSDRAKVEDAVDARVTRDLRVGGRVAIPAGSLVHGTVTEVERGGKVRERARLAVRFHTVVLGNGDKLTLRTDALVREGAAPGRESAAKIGGAAIGGAILGAILGGGKGAAIGAGVGAGGGTAAVMAGDRNTVTIPAGSTVSVRVQQPATVTVEKE
jgi:type IV secretory pathway VirB10-like protein